MIVRVTNIDGVYIILPQSRIDARGFFARTFCKRELQKNGIKMNIVQINQSLTRKKGTIRGMHFQKEPFAEEKIVQCLKGAICDVAVDLRRHSPTYGQSVRAELNDENRKMLYIPKGFAHGFQTLSDDCIVQYLMSQYYQSEYAAGARWNDPHLRIDWPVKDPVLSKKDKSWPLLK